MNVLIIDDSFTTRSFIKNALSTIECTVHEAANGLEGYQKKKETHPHVIILDLLMPVMDGFEFLEKCKAENNTTPIIVLTADIQEEVKKECLDLGAVAFLNKPFVTAELIKLLNTYNK